MGNPSMKINMTNKTMSKVEWSFDFLENSFVCLRMLTFVAAPNISALRGNSRSNPHAPLAGISQSYSLVSVCAHQRSRAAIAPKCLLHLELDHHAATSLTQIIVSIRRANVSV